MSIQKDKYTRLLSNTMLFGISTFSSKVLSFLLIRLHTSLLTEEAYGTADYIITLANLLLPLVSLGISNAVIRFGLEKNVSKSGVFTGGLVATFSGFAILAACYPLLSRIKEMQGYVLMLYAFVLISCLRTLACQFVRAKMYIRLYAIDGILSTLYTLGFNILFLVVLKMGTTGLLLAIIAADALSILFLLVVARLPKYAKPKAFDKKLYKSMLRYSLPLVPAMMFWWITSASDRIFITNINGSAANGLYAAASRIPSIVTILSTIFTEAWQVSAVTDGQGEDQNAFFSQVFSVLIGIAFFVGGGLIFTSRFAMGLLAPSFPGAWQFVPFLILSSIFSSFVAFLNSVYMLEKKSTLSLVTLMAGAVVNLILNAVLIPIYGPNGAGFATFASYLLVFIIRAINTRSFIVIEFSPLKVALNTLLLLSMAFIMVFEVPMYYLWSALLLAAVFWINLSSLYKGVLKLLAKKLKKGAPKP